MVAESDDPVVPPTDAGPEARVDAQAEGEGEAMVNVSSRDWLLPRPTFVDHFTADWFTGGIVRISFGEWLGARTPAIYRTALAMTVSDAKELAEALLRIVEQFEADKEQEPIPQSEK